MTSISSANLRFVIFSHISEIVTVKLSNASIMICSKKMRRGDNMRLWHIKNYIVMFAMAKLGVWSVRSFTPNDYLDQRMCDDGDDCSHLASIDLITLAT